MNSWKNLVWFDKNQGQTFKKKYPTLWEGFVKFKTDMKTRYPKLWEKYDTLVEQKTWYDFLQENNVRSKDELVLKEFNLETGKTLKENLHPNMSGLLVMLSSDDLSKLASSGNEHIREYVAKHSETPPAVLQRLAFDFYPAVQRGVAQNLNTPPATLQELSQLKDKEMQKLIAENPNTPEGVLVKLSEHKDHSIRQLVACNPSTPQEVLIKLASDQNIEVKESVVSNKNITTKIANRVLWNKENPAHNERRTDRAGLGSMIGEE